MISIHYSIATYNLGDNTEADNESYAAAVETAIQAHYPDATVDVDLHDDGGRDVLTTGRSTTYEQYCEIEEICGEISQRVWDDAEYLSAGGST